MKELSIEEKARAYDEALKVAKDISDGKATYIPNGTTVIEAIFPELKESEDEKIRKAIHIYLDWLDGRKDYQPKGEYTIRDMIAWIEKQGKQSSPQTNERAWLAAANKASKLEREILTLKAKIGELV